MAAARPYVPVRVTDMRGIDLDTYRFDFDLTFYVLLMHPDGTVYHRYGGRDEADAQSRLSLPSLTRLLQKGLESDRAYRASGARRETQTARTLDEIPAWRRKVAQQERAGKPLGCYHCHFVYDAEREQLLEEDKWERSRIWRWPGPERIGLILARDEQELVVSVTPDSPAEAAGLQPGDRLLELSGQRVLSQADVSWALEQLEAAGQEVPVSYLREAVTREAVIRLEPGWREQELLEFSWRPSKWQLRPRPGFGGGDLSGEDRRALGLAPSQFAFRVGYLVTWGPDPRYGRAASKAGLRKGDVVVDVNGVDLKDAEHFHTWWRLTRTPGETVSVTVLRKGRRRVLEIPVLADPE